MFAVYNIQARIVVVDYRKNAVDGRNKRIVGFVGSRKLEAEPTFRFEGSNMPKAVAYPCTGFRIAAAVGNIASAVAVEIDVTDAVLGFVEAHSHSASTLQTDLAPSRTLKSNAPLPQSFHWAFSKETMPHISHLFLQKLPKAISWRLQQKFFRQSPCPNTPQTLFRALRVSGKKVSGSKQGSIHMRDVPLSFVYALNPSGRKGRGFGYQTSYSDQRRSGP